MEKSPYYFHKYLQKAQRFICKNLIKYSKNPRPGSYPFISGDGFRSLANHRYERIGQVFAPSAVLAQDIVFVSAPVMEHFLANINPKISRPYVLITHNGDEAVTDKLAAHINDNIIHWFGQNVALNHEKITPLPIGLESLFYYHNGIPRNFKKRQTQAGRVKKVNRILYGFNVKSNPVEREPALEYFCHNPLSDKISGWPFPPQYLEKLQQYKFVASPPGNGIDCIRTWEAMYLGVVPIVKRSVLTEYFASLGLPIWIMDQWNELDGFTEDGLKEKYEYFCPLFGSPALYMDYWISLIRKYSPKLVWQKK